MSQETRELTNEERTFFSLIKQAMLANPFSVQREDLDKKISGTSSASGPSTLLEKAVEAVKEHIQALDRTDRGNINVDDNFQTNVEGVFAAGDAKRGASLVVWAIQEGKETAKNIHEYLMA